MEGLVIESAVKPTHRQRGKVEAWHYHGQPEEEWPDWIRSHYFNRGIRLPLKRKGAWAVRDDEGYFWRWFDSDEFTSMFEPIG